MKTCKGCKHFKRAMIRGQWFDLCRVTGKTAPMVWCRRGEDRFEIVRVVMPREMAAELL